ELVDDLSAVLEDAGSLRPTLFGFSDGGAHCAMVAATRPEQVSGLVLYATAARGMQAPDYPWQWSEVEWQEYLDDVRSGWGTRDYADRSLSLFAPSLGGDPQQVVWWERFLRGSASPNGIYAQEQVYRATDIRRLL